MPVFTSSIEVTADYPTIKPSLSLNFAKSRALDSRITFTRSTIATYIDRSGLVKYAGVNEPRFDHDPLTGESLGLLLEETRTNIFRNSDFSGGTTDWTIGSWDGSNLSYGTENVVLPTGETGPAWYVERTGNRSSAHWHQNYHSYPTNTRVAWSVWGKGQGAFNMRRLSGWTVVSTNASDYGDPNNSTSFTLSPTEWRRFVVIMDAGGSVGYPYFASESQTQGVRCHYWGAQIEEGQFVSSFIKSPTGSGATRAADNAEIMYDGWYDNSSSVKPSTFVGKFQTYNLVATRMVAEGSNGSTLKDFSMNTLANSSNFQFVHRYTANDSYDNTEGSGITINTPVTFAFSYDGTGGDITGSANSSTPNVGTDDLGTTSQAGGDRMRIGSRGNNSLYLNGTIAELRYYKFKASSAQLLLLQ